MQHADSVHPKQSGYPGWHYQPLRLLKKEMENPWQVVKEFFSSYTLPQARKHVEEIRAAMCATEPCSVNCLALCHSIEKLIEAAWLLQEKETETGAKSKEENGTLAAILKLVVAAIHPERIFLLSYEEDRLVDLLIIVPDSSAKPFAHYETLVSLACHAVPEVSVSFHTSSGIKQHLEEAHPFYVFACTHNKEVYSTEPAPLLIGDLASKKRGEESMAHVRAGYAKSTAFFEGAKACFENNDMSTCLFMLHQAAELWLRALILTRLGREVKEHALAVLAKHLRRVAPELVPFLLPGSEKEKELLHLLDSAYLAGRYQPSFSPAAEDTLWLMDRVAKLRDECEAYITS